MIYLQATLTFSTLLDILSFITGQHGDRETFVSGLEVASVFWEHIEAAKLKL